MKAILVNVGEEPVQIDVPNTWEGLRDAIGVEWIEFYRPFSDRSVAICCDEEGKLNGSHCNRVLFYKGQFLDAIFGNFLIVGEGNGDCKSLTKDQIEKHKNLFQEYYIFLD